MVDGQRICHNIPTLRLISKDLPRYKIAKNAKKNIFLPTCAKTILAPKQRMRMTVEIQRAVAWVEDRSNHNWYV